MKTNLPGVIALATSSLFAGTPADNPTGIQVTEPSSPWWLTIAPYGWVTATEGDMGVAGRVAAVDISFKDTLEDLEMAFMLAVEGGFDRWAFGIDGIYGGLSSNAEPSGRAAPNLTATVDFDQFLGRIHAGYQVLAGEKATLTTFVGARYSRMSTELVLSGPLVGTLSADGSKSWIDPIAGLHGLWKINDRWFLHGGGDIGGFGASSDLIWQANAALGCRFTDSFSALVGYRAMGIDYTDGGFLVDTLAHGPVIGVSIRF